MEIPEAALRTIGGRFAKIVFAQAVGQILTTGALDRPAARFNRRGEDALYLSPDLTSAKVAIGGYVRNGDAPRVAVEIEVESCAVLDLRHEMAMPLYDCAKMPWLDAIGRGDEPPSWRVSDALRARGIAGLIDPSRRRPHQGLWALTLFRWNIAGSPRVSIVSTPNVVEIAVGFR